MNIQLNINNSQDHVKRELLHTANGVVDLCRDLCSQHKENQFTSTHKFLPLLYHLHAVNEDMDILAKRITYCVDNSSLITQIRIGSLLRKQIQKQISHCALLEMKNISIKSLSHQLKQELIKLNDLQSQWFNMSCLKN